MSSSFFNIDCYLHNVSLFPVPVFLKKILMSFTEKIVADKQIKITLKFRLFFQ